MRKKGIPEAMVRAVTSLKVQRQESELEELSQEFEVKVGVYKGSV